MIRIALVDDHALVRAGLRQFFSEQPDLCVVGEAATAAEAMALVRLGGLDVLLLDINLPGVNGLDALVAVHARAPKLPILMLSGFAEQHYATLVLRLGASGYLNKDCDPDTLVLAVRQLAAGRRYLSAAVAEQLAAALALPADAAAQPAHTRLSAREMQVFLHLAQGHTVAQVAQTLCLSVKTISTYRSRVLDKLALHSNSDLTYHALRLGLLA